MKPYGIVDAVFSFKLRPFNNRYYSLDRRLGDPPNGYERGGEHERTPAGNRKPVMLGLSDQ